MDTASLVFLDIWTFVWSFIGIFLAGWVARGMIGVTLTRDIRTLVDKIAKD